MAARITLALLAICLLQFAACTPAATTANPLDEFQKTATDFLNNLNTHFNALINVKDNEEIKKIYQENSDAIADKVAEISNNIKQQYKGVDEQVKSSLDKASNDLDAAVNNLKKKNPELQKKANELGSSFKQGVQNVLQEAQKAAQTLAKNTEGLDTAVADNLKKLYSEVVSELQATSTRLHAVSNKH